MKSRELMDLIREAGGVFVRTKGDHYMFRLPNGRFIDVPHGGRQTEAAISLVAKFKRLVRESAQ